MADDFAKTKQTETLSWADQTIELEMSEKERKKLESWSRAKLVDEIESIRRKVKEEMIEKNKVQGQLQEELDTVKSQKDEITQLKTDNDTSTTALKNDITKLQDDIAQLKTDRVKSETALRNDITKVKGDKVKQEATMKDEYKKLKTDKDTTEATLNGKINQLQAEKDKVEIALKDEITQLKVDNVKSTTTLNGTVTQLRDEITQLKTEKTKAETAHNDEVDKLKAGNDTSETKLKDQIIKLNTDKNNSEATLKGEIDRLRTEKNDAVTTLSNEITRLKKEVNEWKKKSEKETTDEKDTSEEKQELEKKVTELTSKNKMQLEELILVKDQLYQSKLSYEVLMNKLDKEKGNQISTDESDSDPEKAQALFIVDINLDTTKLMIDRKGAQWNWLKIQSLKNMHANLDELVDSEDLFKYDKVILLLGHDDIKEGTDCFDLLKVTKKVVKKLQRLNISITLSQLPPLPGKWDTDVQIYNRKLPEINDVEIIKYDDEIQKVPYSRIVSENGEVSDWGLNMIKTGINTQMEKPIKKPTTTPDEAAKSKSVRNKENIKPGTSGRKGKAVIKQNKKKEMISDDEEDESDDDGSMSDLELDKLLDEDIGEESPGRQFLFFNPTFSGMIIGRRGTTVRAVQAKTKTRISLANKILEGVPTKVAIITGEEKDIAKAKKRLLSMIEQEEKLRGKKREIRDHSTDNKKAKYM